MLLAIDTSGPACSVALYDVSNDAILYELTEELGRGHAERLMPMVQEVLAGAQLEWPQLDSIGVVRGPGSFTGLRVGLAAARGLALALGKPCNGVSVFEAMALEHCSKSPAPLWVVLDAKRQEVWLQAFDELGLPLMEPMARSHLEAAEEIGKSDISRMAGSGASLVMPDHSGIEVLSTAAWPSIDAVARACGKFSLTKSPRPLYLRAPDAKRQVPARQAPREM